MIFWNSKKHILEPGTFVKAGLCTNCDNFINFRIFTIKELKTAYTFITYENQNIGSVLWCPICNFWFKNNTNTNDAVNIDDDTIKDFFKLEIEILRYFQIFFMYFNLSFSNKINDKNQWNKLIDYLAKQINEDLIFLKNESIYLLINSKDEPIKIKRVFKELIELIIKKQNLIKPKLFDETFLEFFNIRISKKIKVFSNLKYGKIIFNSFIFNDPILLDFFNSNTYINKVEISCKNSDTNVKSSTINQQKNVKHFKDIEDQKYYTKIQISRIIEDELSEIIKQDDKNNFRRWWYEDLDKLFANEEWIIGKKIKKKFIFNQKAFGIFMFIGFIVVIASVLLAVFVFS